MLHKETLKRETFELLKTLMHDKELQQFYLTKGTALALYMGHRLSIDLDLFTSNSFDNAQLNQHLHNKYKFEETFIRKNTLKGEINGVKVDFITYSYSDVCHTNISKEGIRLHHIKDIAAMKLATLADNGTRLKDFVDIACLSTKLSLFEMLKVYQQKYPGANPISAVKGLSYYNDINFKESIQMMDGVYKWDRVEKRLNNMIKNNKTVFLDLPIEQMKNDRSRGLKL